MARRQKNQRKDKRFQVSLQLGVINGKRQRLYFYALSKEEAEQKRVDYMRTHEKSQKITDKDITLGQWADRWLSLYKSTLADNTKDMYESGISLIKKFTYEDVKISDMKMTEAKPYHLQALAASMGEYSKSYIRQIRQTVTQIFNTALDNKIIIESPVLHIQYPIGNYDGHRALEEYEKELIYKHWREHRAGVWAMLMMYAGLRRGEMIALKWDNIDLDKRIIHVIASHDVRQKQNKETKTESGIRDVVILPQLHGMLSEIKQNSGEVCQSVEGKQLTETAMRRGWAGYMLVLERALNGIEPYRKTAGWRKDKARGKEGHRLICFTPHDLRYTFATMLYDAGIDVKTAQVLLGHRDLDTTMKIYTRLSEKTKKSSIDKLMDYFKDNQF